MKTGFTKSRIALFIFALLVTAGMGASAYNDATVAPPGDNHEVVAVDSSLTSQVKNGDLSVEAFTAQGNALFAQNLVVKGMIRGDQAANPLSTTPSTVKFGGTDANGAHNVDVQIGGYISTASTIKAANLAHTGSERATICADSTGKIVLCPPPPQPPANTTPTVIGVSAFISQDFSELRCTAQLDYAARTGGEVVSIRYALQSQGGGPQGNVGPADCSVTVDEGQVIGTSVQYFNAGQSFVQSSCAVSSSANIDPTIQC